MTDDDAPDLAGSEIWAQSPAVAQVPSEGRVALINLDRLGDPPMVLERTAAAIWAAIDGQRRVDEVVIAVAEEYGVDPGDVHNDVQSFITDLANRGLLRNA